MPTNFPDLVDGTLILSDHIDRYTSPINRLEEGRAYFGVDTGLAQNAYEVTLAPEPGNPLPAGAMVHFKAARANTGPATLKLNSLAAIPIKKNVDQDLEAGDIAENQVVALIHDGTNLQLSTGARSVGGLDDLSDVTLTSPANLHILQRDASGQFVNRSLAAADIAARSVLDAHLGNLSNPHGVTAAQVGAVPTTRQVNTTSPLLGGGALSANLTLSLGVVPADLGGTGISSHAAGSYLRAASASTLEERTAAQVLSDIGAAAASHAHSAADITSGVLAATRGGTGFGSFTKGDLLVASDASTLVKLGVGSNGQVLAADSLQASGLKWAAGGVTFGGAQQYDLGFVDASGNLTSQAGFFYNTAAANLLANFGTDPPISGAVDNLGLGQFALAALTSGDRNVCLGREAGEALTTGSDNVCIGNQTGNLMTNISNCVFLGEQAGRYMKGQNNIGIGQTALQGNSGGTSTGTFNVGIGYQSLLALTTGDYNVCVGYGSGKALTTGSFNVCAGHQTGLTMTTASDCVFIGEQAGRYVNGNNNIAIGQLAMWGASGGGSTGTLNVALCMNALQGVTTGNYNIGIGNEAAFKAGAASEMVAIGLEACRELTVVSAAATHNIGIGSGACRGATGAVATESIGMGYQALYSLDSGDQNIALGYRAAFLVTTGDSNVCIGYEAGRLGLATTSYNVLVGYHAGYRTSGAENVAVGYEALLGSAVGANNYNVAVGKGTLREITTGASNAAVGSQAGNALTTGSQNAILGASAGYSAGAALTGSVLLGYQAGYSESNSNRLHIANSSSKSLLYGEFNNDNLGLCLTGTAGSFGGAVGAVFLQNATTVPSSNPTGGHILYSESGALKGRGSSGTVTTIAAAEPHCPRCGRDFALEWESERHGKLSICCWCLIEKLEALGIDAFIEKEPAGRAR